MATLFKDQSISNLRSCKRSETLFKSLLFLAGWRSELAGCRTTLSMSRIKVKIFWNKISLLLQDLVSNSKHFEKSFEQLWSGRVLSNVRSFWFCVGSDSGNKFTTICVGGSYMERICIYPKWTWMVSNDSALRSWHVLWLQISGWSQLWNAKLVSGQLAKS